MKRHLNTLFVTTQGTYLAKEGETVAVKVDGQVRLRVPIHTLGGIVCFGNVICSPFLLGFCAEKGVSISFLTENGRFLARVLGPVSGNVLLRREQYRWADDPERSAELASWMVIGKVANCRTVLRRFVRDHGENPMAELVKDAAERLAGILESLKHPLPLNRVRGYEGEAAQHYFRVFGHLVTTKKEDFAFSSRTRRPPLDRVNCLLSYIYTILMHDIRGALESVGLDPAVGFLHRDRPGRPSLALDLMEEFRAFLADRLTLSLINLGQIRPEGFSASETGAWTMDEQTRKAVLVAYQKRKQDQMIHPFLGEKMPVGLLFHTQALLLARYLRGDLDAYPPFVWR